MPAWCIFDFFPTFFAHPGVFLIWLPEWKLLGIVIVLGGLILRWKTGPVVLASALITGLLAGFPVIGSPEHPGVLPLLGKAFLDNRLITLYLLTLPAVGVAERYGLHEQAGQLVSRLRVTTLDRLLLAFQSLRIGLGILGIRLNGHTVFSRPIIYPMAAKLFPKASPQALEQIKAAVSACENYGNFFGQNLFSASAGCLLVYSTLKANGLIVPATAIPLWAIPMVAISMILAFLQFRASQRDMVRPTAAAASEAPSPKHYDA